MDHKIKSFEDACTALGLNSAEALPQGLPKHVQAFIMLTIIAQALNEGWQPDWKNWNEYKYYPWFDMNAPSGFAYYGCVSVYAAAPVGSRLCYKSSDLAKYAGTHFLDIYRDLYTF